MKAPYKNATRSKILIRNAMISLLNKKNLSEICVSDIVKVADINRGTFYNHYNNPVEVLKEIQDELMEKLSQGLKNISKSEGIDELISVITDHFLKNEKDYKIIVKAIPMSIVDKIKQEFIEKINKINNHKVEPIIVYFVINGLTGLYLDYLKDNVSFNSNDIKQITKSIISNVFK